LKRKVEHLFIHITEKGYSTFSWHKSILTIKGYRKRQSRETKINYTRVL